MEQLGRANADGRPLPEPFTIFWGCPALMVVNLGFVFRSHGQLSKTPRGYLDAPGHSSSIIPSSQKVGATQRPFDVCMDKQLGVHACNGTSSSLEKEENSDTCYNMGEP